MSARCTTCQSDDGTPRVCVPVRRAQTDEGRYEVDALLSVTEVPALHSPSRFDDSETIAQPLYRRARDKDTAFESVFRLLARAPW
jgi:hypothetical protein